MVKIKQRQKQRAMDKKTELFSRRTFFIIIFCSTAVTVAICKITISLRNTIGFISNTLWIQEQNERRERKKCRRRMKIKCMTKSDFDTDTMRARCKWNWCMSMDLTLPDNISIYICIVHVQYNIIFFVRSPLLDIICFHWSIYNWNVKRVSKNEKARERGDDRLGNDWIREHNIRMKQRNWSTPSAIEKEISFVASFFSVFLSVGKINVI